MSRDSMTLDEVIQFTKQALEKVDPDVNTEFRFEVWQVKQLLLWLEDYKQLKADYADLDNRLRTANTENDEMKRLLRLAVDDIGKLKNCEKYPFCGGCPKESEPLCKWKHRDEAMKLLGGAEDVEN